MLTTTEARTRTGLSIVDGVTVERYTVELDCNNPSAMSAPRIVTLNKDLYKENREACRADRVQFEEEAYAWQDELIEEAAGDDTETEDE